MKNKSVKEKQDWLKKNWITKSLAEQAEYLGVGTATISRWGVSMKLPKRKGGVKMVHLKELSVKEKINLDRQKKKLLETDKDDKKKYKALLQENEQLQKLLNVSESLEKVKPYIIKEDKTSGESRATAFALASDWHVEQKVDGNKILYPNEYNLDIAKARAEQFFQGLLVMINEAEQNVKIHNLVLWLGGDFITGNIHTENLKICQLGAPQAIAFARDLLVSGIKFLLKNTDVQITIPYNHGNHARITDKVWKSSEEDNSLEFLLYDQIRKYFEEESRITVVVPRGSVATVEVYGLKIGFVHGHHGFRYQDGVGGLYIPARKYIQRKFHNAGYYLICMGHHHQYLQDTYFICNGSMIGYDQYADSCGFPFDIPKQTFFLIEEKRKCRTVTRPILFNQ